MYYSIENRRYIWSKTKLLNWIFKLIDKNCKWNSFVDLFAWTWVVSSHAIHKFDSVIMNDLLYSNNVIYNGFFWKWEFDIDKLKIICNKYNELNVLEIKDNYFSNNFWWKYFEKNIAKTIWYIRDDIEKNKNILTNKEYNILLTSLIYSSDKLANTVWHYEAYFKKIKKTWTFKFKLIKPFLWENVIINRENANNLVKNIEADIFYIDPPYNSRQYSRFYHVLETLIKWDNPKLFWVALKPETENTSDYCKTKAPMAFKDLITSINGKYIVVSYNNTYNPKSNSSKNKITLDEIKEILEEKWKTEIFTKSHKSFNTWKTDFEDHQELLFITKIKRK